MKMASLHILKDQASKLYKSHFIDLVYQMFKIKNTWKNVLYIHSPFCSQKCKYCVYHSFVPSLEQKTSFYQSYLPKQIKEYYKILNEVTFDEVYFGGGTPTVADSTTLERIFDNIPHFRDIPTKMIEVHPYSLTQAHIDLFSKFGFKYISMGVQTLSTRILKKQNRLVVTKKKLMSICSQLTRTGIIFNIDLIFFLESGELSDLEQGKKDLIYVLSVLKPTSVVIHLNYRVKKLRAKNEEVIRLIRRVLRLFPRYKCVNSLLQQKDAFNDSQFNAEYRLMRDNYDFEFYLLGKYPNLPVYGYNIIGIGYYNNMAITSNYYHSYSAYWIRIFCCNSQN